MAEPTGHNWHDTEANEGFAGTRAKNLAQTVFEYKEVALPPEHLNPHSILHEAEQPSPAAVLLSSQKFAVLVSAPIVLPSPHIAVQFDRAHVWLLEHPHPDSTRQFALHPSLLLVLPSSHASMPARMESPHVVLQTGPDAARLTAK
jgi:hypothetical protein